MNHSLRCLVLVVGCLLALRQAASAAPKPDAAEVEQMAVRQRASIREGRVTLDVVEHEADGKVKKYEARMWLSGESMRSDFNHPQKEKGASRLISCVPCERPSHYLNARFVTGFEKPQAVMLGPLNARTRATAEVCDLRTVGLLPISLGILYGHQVRDIIAVDRMPPTARETEWNGRRCQVVESRTKDGGTRAVWVVPDYEHSIVRAELRGTSSGKPYLYSVESQLQQYGPRNTWYPKTVRFENRVDNKVVAREDISVREADFGNVDPVTFTIQGLGLPAGTVVSDGKSSRVWDGKELTSRNLPTNRNLPQAVDEPAPARTWFTILAVAFALVAVAAAIFLYFRGRGSSTEPSA